MNKISSLVLVGVFTVSLSAYAFDPVYFAGKANVNSKVDEKKAERAEAMADKKAKVEAKKEEVKAKIDEKKAEMQEKVCERVEKRIALRVKKYEQNRDRDRKVFGNMQDKFDRLVSFFKGYDLDTTKLEADIATFKEKVAEAEQLHNQFINSLGETERVACGESDGQYRKMLQSSQQEMVALKNQILEVRGYYRDVIREDALELRKQLEELLGYDVDEVEDVNEDELESE